MGKNEPTKMTREQQRLYQVMLAKAKQGEISDDDISSIVDNMMPDYRMSQLLSVSRTTNFRRQYMNKYVTLNPERVPDKLKRNFERAYILENQSYRVMDVGEKLPPEFWRLEQDRPKFGWSETLPWLEKDIRINPETPEENPLIFLTNVAKAQMTTFFLEVPTPIFPGVANVPRLAYTYFFDIKK